MRTGVGTELGGREKVHRQAWKMRLEGENGRKSRPAFMAEQWVVWLIANTEGPIWNKNTCVCHRNTVIESHLYVLLQ